MMGLKISLFLSSNLWVARMKIFYPNIRRIFIIMLTLPETSVCCEISFSSLRRLKTWERATMGKKGLCGLAILHVHLDMNVSWENILRRFDGTRHRKIGTLQFEWQFISSNHTYYMLRTFPYYGVEFISICFFHGHLTTQPLHDFLLFKAMNTICQLDGNFDLQKQPL